MADEEDRLLPIANVGRIMKRVLPPTAKISKEGKQKMQECASEFVSFVTSEAADRCHKENRKVVNGDDICWALSSLGFDDYADAVVRFLHKYRQAERQKGNENSGKTTQDEDNEKSCQRAEQQIQAPMLLEFRVLQKGNSHSLPLSNPSRQILPAWSLHDKEEEEEEA